MKRSLIIVNILVTVMAMVPSAVLAEDIGPGSIRELRDSSDDTRAAALLVKGICDSFGILQSSGKTQCEGAWKEGLFSTASVKGCGKTSPAGGVDYSVECLNLVLNKDVSPAVFAGCKPSRERRENRFVGCLKTFVGTDSVYDQDAVAFCASLETESEFHNCVNRIANRAVKAADLKKCKGKDNMISKWEDSFDGCMEKAAKSAPLRTDVLCKASAVKAGGALPKSPGFR